MLKFKFLFKLFFSLIVLFVLFYFIGFYSVLSTLMQLNLVFLLLSLIFFFLLLLITALSYFVIFNSLKKISFLRFFKYYLFSWTIGLIGFGKLGELSLLYFLKEIELGKSTAAFILSSIITILSLALLSLLGIYFFKITNTLNIIILIFLGCIFFVLLFFSNKGRTILKKFIPFKEKFKSFGLTLNELIKNKKILIASISLTFLRWIALAFFSLFLFYGFNVKPNFFELIFINSIASLISFVPVSFNGLGVREASFVSLAFYFGIPLNVSSSVMLVSLALNYFFGFLIALIFIKDLSKIKALKGGFIE